MARIDFDNSVENLTAEEQALLTQTIQNVLTHPENVPRIKKAIDDIHSGERAIGLRNMSELLQEEFQKAGFLAEKPTGTTSFKREELRSRLQKDTVARNIINKTRVDPSVILARFGLSKEFKSHSSKIRDMLFVHRVAQQLREYQRKTGRTELFLAEIEKGTVSDRIQKILGKFWQLREVASLPLNKFVKTDIPNITNILHFERKRLLKPPVRTNTRAKRQASTLFKRGMHRR